MVPQWQFKQDELERWRWTCVELHGEPIDSATSFANRMSCVLDAVRYAVHHHRSQPKSSADASGIQAH